MIRKKKLLFFIHLYKSFIVNNFRRKYGLFSRNKFNKSC